MCTLFYCLASSGARQGLFHASLARRYVFSSWELIQAIGLCSPLSDVEKAALHGETLQALLRRFTTLIYPESPDDVARIMELYAKEPEQAAFDEDPEFLQILEELSTCDPINTSDVKAWKITATANCSGSQSATAQE